MMVCSLHRRLEIVPGGLSDYEHLAPHHYRAGRPAVIKAVFTLRPKRAVGSLGKKAAGVIVYSMPHPRVALRAVGTGGIFAGLDRQSELALLNRNVRCIARLIIEPRFRGVGLATRLVRQTLPLMGVPIIEALGVMPKVNPFLERAGMQAFAPQRPLAPVELIEAFSTVGIESDQLIDPAGVQKAIDSLGWPAADFLETRIGKFLKSHGTRRTLPPGLERTRYILGKLTDPPAYYVWFHPDLEVTTP